MFTGIFALYHLIAAVAGWLTLGSLVLVTSVVVSMSVANPEGYTDPFLQYADLTPRQPIGILGRYLCQSEYCLEYAYGDRTQCITYPNDEVFSRISVVTYYSQIETVSFFGKNLQVVDLVRVWGKPDQVIENGWHFVLRWDNGVTSVTESSQRRFSYQLPVNFVALSYDYQHDAAKAIR